MRYCFSRRSFFHRKNEHNLQITVTDDIDTVFFWESTGDDLPNKCRIRICWITWEKAVIIATDITDNPGKKIADVTQEIISFASKLYDLAPNKVMLVEHYAPNTLCHQDTYLQVIMTHDETIRYEIDESELVQLIGKSIY